MLIFYSQPPLAGTIYKEEYYLYYSNVNVRFNKTAYNNKELFLEWIAKELSYISPKEEYLLVIDVASFYIIDNVLLQLC